ncbi:MAG: hypothetical protein CMB61_05725 [Euryarchaeota archaeon]|nr:hypothetical protein [Euryarchaeota archaeon]
MRKRVMALSIAFFVLSSVMAAPASSQTAVDPKQPSVDNPHMHFWGTSDLSSCWSHFDGNDSTGSAEEGYGSRTYGSGQVEISMSCRNQENYKEHMFLNPNGTILIEIGVAIYSDDCDQEIEKSCLTLSLRKGNLVVASEVFPATDNSFNDEQIRWEIPVDANMTEWNKSQEEPTLDIEYSAPGYNGVECGWLNDCTGEFRLYYSDNQEGMDVVVNWPIINVTDQVEPEEEGGSGESSGGGLPGFGILAGLSAMAMAVIAPRRGSRSPPQ